MSEEHIFLPSIDVLLDSGTVAYSSSVPCRVYVIYDLAMSLLALEYLQMYEFKHSFIITDVLIHTRFE